MRAHGIQLPSAEAGGVEGGARTEWGGTGSVPSQAEEGHAGPPAENGVRPPPVAEGGPTHGKVDDEQHVGGNQYVLSCEARARTVSKHGAKFTRHNNLGHNSVPSRSPGTPNSCVVSKWSNLSTAGGIPPL
jgi:hypothetical protein